MSSTNENIFIGKRLLQVRNSKHLSQEDFSKSLGISLRGYQNYERGEREVSKELICSLLDNYRIDPVWLLTGEGEMYRRSGIDTSIEDIPEWLREWWAKADERERNWLEVELKRLRMHCGTG